MPGAETPKGWRIVIISQVLPVAEPLCAHLRELGHEPVAWLMARRKEGDERPLPPWGEITDSKVPAGLSLLFAPDKYAVAPLLRGLEPDLVLCAGFPWKLPQAALDVARLGSVNEHPALLPRHRGPIPLAWALREGDGQFGADLAPHGRRARHRRRSSLRRPCPIEDEWTTIEEMGPHLIQASFALLPKVFERIAAGDPGDPQTDEGASWAGPLRRGLRDRRLVSARPQDPRPGARLAPHVRPLRRAPGRSRSSTASASSSCARASPTRGRAHGPSSRGDGQLWIVESEPASYRSAPTTRLTLVPTGRRAPAFGA